MSNIQGRLWAAAIFVVFFTARPLPAQTATGTILGNVSDSSGAAMAGVAVRATNTLTQQVRNGISDNSGNYVISDLTVGQYTVMAEQPGFKLFVHAGIILDVNRNARVDVKLDVGAVSERVEVTGDAPVVDTHQVQMGSSVDSKRAVDLPVNGRNVYSLASILPGVTTNTPEALSTRNGNTLNVNGSRNKNSTFLLDGGFNTTLWRTAGQAAPNPDAIQELEVITNNFNAQYGRSSGAVVNVVSKSGTNEFHGTLFEFLRNNNLNANRPFRRSIRISLVAYLVARLSATRRSSSLPSRI